MAMKPCSHGMLEPLDGSCRLSRLGRGNGRPKRRLSACGAGTSKAPSAESSPRTGDAGFKLAPSGALKPNIEPHSHVGVMRRCAPSTFSITHGLPDGTSSGPSWA